MYRVIDYYENVNGDLINDTTYDTADEAINAAVDFDNDTDGENTIVIEWYDSETNSWVETDLWEVL